MRSSVKVRTIFLVMISLVNRLQKPDRWFLLFVGKTVGLFVGEQLSGSGPGASARARHV